MNGIEKITARIETDAVADAARIADEAKRQCEAILAEGEAKAQESYWQRVREGVKATEDRVARLAKAADMEARKSILSSKLSLVEEAFCRAEDKLRALSGDDYIDFLAGQAARAAVTGREELILSAEDRKAYGDKTVKKANALLESQGRTGKLTLTSETGAFSGGLVVKDGNISVNCTIEALMAEARENMSSSLAAELFS